jgi:hypothetical protein
MIGSIPVKCEKAPAADTKVDIVKITNVTLTEWDRRGVDVDIATGVATVNVRAKAATARINLDQTIKSCDNIKVTYGTDGKTIDTTLALSGNGKEIAVTPVSALTDGKEYTVTVEGAGFTTSNTTKFTADKGEAVYTISDFVAGDINADGKITFADFAEYCKKAASNDTACDLNRDGTVDDGDLSVVNAALEKAGDTTSGKTGTDANLTLEGKSANRAVTIDVKLDKAADLEAFYLVLDYSDNMKFKELSSLTDGYKGLKVVDDENGRLILAVGKKAASFDESIATIKFNFSSGDPVVKINAETKLEGSNGEIAYTAGELAINSGKTITLQIGNQQIVTNGVAKELDVPAQLINDRTMVPLRAIFEALDATVEWDDPTQTVTSTRGSTTISLQIGSNQLYVNGVAKELDVPAQLVNDRTLVPVRAIAESFGCQVGWEEATETVTISE